MQNILASTFEVSNVKEFALTTYMKEHHLALFHGLNETIKHFVLVSKGLWIRMIAMRLTEIQCMR